MAADPLAWLSARQRFGVKLGLDAVGTLLAALGHPEHGLPVVLVAGTNGKGSTAAMVAATLTAAGERTLLYSSPHVADTRERIRLDGRPIRREALSLRLAEVHAAVTRLRRGRRLSQQPTYFEVLTAAALLQARAGHATAGVFEVGLGGRFDATNVIPAKVAVITGIDRDHTEYLGHTLERIAWNKAGIIKPEQDVLTLEWRRELLRVFRRECRSRGARLTSLSGNVARRSRSGRWDLDLTGARPVAGRRLPAHMTGVRLGLRGEHQGAQAVLGVMAATALLARTGGHLPSAKALRSALAGVSLPGRCERRRLSSGRLLVVDAAHNPAATICLAHEIRDLADDRPVTLLFGVLADKDARAMLKPLIKLVDTVILTQPKHPRGMKLKALKEFMPLHTAAFVNPRAAWRAALAATPREGVLLVAGSFYLLGDLWADIRRRPLIR